MNAPRKKTVIIAASAALALTASIVMFKGPGVPSVGASDGPNRPGSFTRIGPKNAASVAERVTTAVASRLPEGWDASDAEDIAAAVGAAIPTLAGLGADAYLDDLLDRGLAGSEPTIQARYDRLIARPEWKALVERGAVQQPVNPDLDTMARTLLETHHLVHDDALQSVDLGSVRVYEGSQLSMGTGERGLMTVAMSDDWNASTAQPGVVVEFAGKLRSGGDVRVCFLMASKRTDGASTWGIAGAGFVSATRQRMYPPF